MNPPATNAAAALAPAIAAYRRGDADTALALAQALLTRSRPGDASVHAVIGEVLHRAGRTEALADWLQRHPDFLADARGQLLQARVWRASGQPGQAATQLQHLLGAGPDPFIRRVAGFELVAVLNQLGEHARAWQTATDTHAATTRPFNTDALVAALQQTAQASTAELSKRRQASRRVQRVACMVSLPRSGTTLLEQMLDRHPQLRGNGESPLPGRMADTLAREGGGWPIGALNTPRRTLDALQQQYLVAARGQPGVRADTVVLDKTLFPMTQPLWLATVLPGAKVLRTLRDARDNAVSLYTNNFDPSWGWTGSLHSIHRVLQAERQHMPVILEKLQIDALTLRYEELVESPEAMLQRVLAHLGLPWHPAVLDPQHNQRLVYTLSHEQVRRPVNRDGMGRWQRHAEHFGADWDALQ